MEKLMTIKVIAASGSSRGMAMGDLIEKGILRKEYRSTGYPDNHDIIWTNISKDTIVENEFETLRPGEHTVWEK